jgi:chromosome partitioning protein
MNPKMTIIDAAACLGQTKTGATSLLTERGLSYFKSNAAIYFKHETARKFFQFSFTPRVIVFQIVKGGTGKTSLVYEFAIRASLYGARVLCVDMDQQGNLTHAFHQDAEGLPVMIDALVDHHSLEASIVQVAPGIDLLPSRFENAMLDEVLRLKNLPLELVYREPLQRLKNHYDVIVVDCPPSLGRSVAACALAADYLLAPVTPEKFALSGLDIVYQSVEELQDNFDLPINLGVVLNKFEFRTTLSQDALKYLQQNPKYNHKLLKNCIRTSQEFPRVMANSGSIFDVLKPTTAKEDIDHLTQTLLEIVPLFPSIPPAYEKTLMGSTLARSTS